MITVLEIVSVIFLLVGFFGRGYSFMILPAIILYVLCEMLAVLRTIRDHIMECAESTRQQNLTAAILEAIKRNRTL